jgi:Bacterial SH3 domain
MDNEIDSIIPEDGQTGSSAAEKPAPKKIFTEKPAKAAKPLVEGINSPRSTQDVILVKTNLSQKEKELVAGTADVAQPLGKAEARLMPESVSASVNKKDHHIGRWLLIFVVLLILVAGCYELYAWQLQKGQTPIVGHYHPLSTEATSSDSLGGQPFPLAGGSIASSATSTLLTVTSTSTAPTNTPPASVKQVKVTSTPTGYLNVRSSPSSAGTIVTQVHPGEVYTYTNQQNGWYEITYSGLNQGWVSGQYVVKQ